ncbi:MAG: UDP-N-acetylmuramoyl-L-alanine--D-glutamate ligase [Chlamydiia bacterium]|nr:UDP-N-acetylmuramoyl-L-alanine--D-glutamate ligase [Chlamydiia bacterium]
MKTWILGLGVSGRAAAKFLLSRGERVVGWDAKKVTPPEGVELAEEPTFQEAKAVVYSPGMPPNHPLLERARALNLPVIGEIDLGLRHFSGPSVAITGTNGKTTVTELVAHALCFAGKPADAVGNNGVAFTEWLLTNPAGKIAVCELSSYQLETLGYKNFIRGVILNIAEDHLDRYGTMEAYTAAKLRLGECGPLYVHPNLKVNYPSYLDFAAALNLTPPFNFEKENLIAAYCLVEPFGVDPKTFLAAAQTFKKPPHRLEFVRSLRGVDYYNDSKGTNVDAVLRAVESFNRPVVLIAGGKDKGGSYEPWRAAFSGKVKGCVLIGEAKEKIARAIEGICPTYNAETLIDAVRQAEAIASAPDVVLLSPGCASFDMFENFGDRGNQFVQAVSRI